VSLNNERENAPLVELIAEVRWAPAAPTQAPLGGATGPVFVFNAGALNGIVERFGDCASELGYSESERLVPPNFPSITYQPVIRYKHKENGETRSLYQLGAGIFSAHAVPPYKSWPRFEPVVRDGIEALLKARDETDIDRGFSAVSLRYIDAFGPHLTEGRTVLSFLSEVLGIKINIPPALAKHLRKDSTITPALQFQLPMNDGMVMSVSLGEGSANGVTAIMMDTSIASTIPVQATLESVMSRFRTAHDAISGSFLQLVQPIEHLMPPKTNPVNG
jgi:uncharacterized protein (TIGR04255 family)